MKKVYVMDNRGREKVADKIAYFKVEDKKYFIYTLNEIDSEGYLKLYIKQLENGEDVEILDIEWEHVRGIVQEVLRQMRDGVIETYEMLDFDDVTEVMESGARVFKLKQEIVEQIKNQDLKEEEENYNFENVDDFSSALIEAFKKAAKKPKVLEKIEENVDNILDNNEEKEIPIAYEEPDKKEEVKVKPYVVSNVPVFEYQETIMKLEQDTKQIQEVCQNLKNENDKLLLEIDNMKKNKRLLESENERLKNELENCRGSVTQYQKTLEHLKDIMKGIE